MKKSPWMAKVQQHGGFVCFITAIVFAVLAFIPGVISAVIYVSIIMITAVDPCLIRTCGMEEGGTRHNTVCYIK